MDYAIIYLMLGLAMNVYISLIAWGRVKEQLQSEPKVMIYEYLYYGLTWPIMACFHLDSLGLSAETPRERFKKLRNLYQRWSWYIMEHEMEDLRDEYDL